jgi:L-alanine-DL-glutamate epimerase-like enolase superfamily enzyme
MRSRIVAVEAIPLAVTGLRPFRISEGQTATHYSVLLRLLTQTPGLEGNAEMVSAPPGKPEEFLEEIVGGATRYIAPALAGQDALDRRSAMAAVEAVMKGRVWSKAAVANALVDLQGKLLGVSAATLLGGRAAARVPVIGPVVGIMAPAEMAAIAGEQAAAGFKAVKIKVGDTVDADIDRVRACREAMAKGVRLRVDANDHYRPADAIRLVRAIERYDIEHVEQPLARGDLLGMAEVKARTSIPLMTDDMVATPAEAMNVIRLAAADRMKVKVTKHGLEGAALIANMLIAAGLTPVLGHVFEMGLAAVAEAQLAAAYGPVLAGPHEIGSLRPMGATADIVKGELRPEPGFMTVPDGPGLGVTLDWDAIERLRIDRGAGGGARRS